MRPGIVVRDFETGDQRSARSLILAGLGEHFGHVDDSLNRDLDDIAQHYAGQRLIIAEEGQRIVGTGFLRVIDETTAEVVRMSVASDVRRSGVGRAILRVLLDHARQEGFARVVLFTLEDWHDAVAFYSSCGFRECGRIALPFGIDIRFEIDVARASHLD